MGARAPISGIRADVVEAEGASPALGTTRQMATLMATRVAPTKWLNCCRSVVRGSQLRNETWRVLKAIPMATHALACRCETRNGVIWSDGTETAEQRIRVDLSEVSRSMGSLDRGRLDKARYAAPTHAQGADES